MGRQDLAPDAADQEVLFAPVELEGFAQFEFERHVGIDRNGPAGQPPAPDKLRDAAVVARKTRSLDFTEQFQRAALVAFGPVCVGFQGFDELRCVWRYLGAGRSARRLPPSSATA